MDDKQKVIERLDLLQKAEKSPELQASLREMCKRDIVFWFNNFCWTYDPRRQPVPWVPFVLYDFQEWCVKEWLDCIENQRDFGVEKSRDMGASWMMMLVFHYCFLFRPGWNFHVGSRKQEFVDKGGLDPSTLFGKIDSNHERLPTWMKPKVHRKELFLQNSENMNLITGESSNPSFGRAARYRAVLFDELAFWAEAEDAYAACSATTNCRAVISTPYGETNKYARLMNDKRNELRLPAVKPRNTVALQYVAGADGKVISNA